MHGGRQTLFQLGVLLSGLVMACLVILLLSDEPATALRYFFTGPFRSRYFFGNLLATATPLIITGLAAAVAFSAGVWNMGTEGMVYTGMLLGTVSSLFVQGLPPLLGIAVMMAAAFVGGAALGLVCHFLEHYFDVDRMICTLLASNAVLYLGFLLVKGPLKDPSSGQGVTTFRVGEKFMFPDILPPSELDTGLFVALALVVLVTLLLRRHKRGYELTITGKSERFARYGGISTAAVAALAMALSGGLCGLGGMTHLLGTSGRVRAMFTGLGWNGLSIAMIARSNPVLVVPVALFFAFLEHGAESASLFADITPDIAQVIEGAVLLLVTSEALYDRLGRRKAPKDKAVET